MNAAVAKLADAANRGGRVAGASREPLKVLGEHPRTGLEIKLMDGRYGAYVTDGTTKATIPKTIEKDALTLEEAAPLIDERAATGPTKAQKKLAAKQKPAAKKHTAKKAPAQKARSKARRAGKDVIGECQYLRSSGQH